ncbi:hypothetical protein JCM16303_006244 [Sporobolomyces ruberrimus]
MPRRKHHHDQASTTSSNRTPALLISLSSLLLSAGLSTCLYVLTESLKDQLDGDLDQAGVVAWWASDAGLKWGLISATGSLAGVVGILIHNSSLHRVFAVSTFADLLLTLLLTFTLSLLTFTPSLSPTFGSFLCSSVLSSSYDSPSGSTGSHILRVERDRSNWAPAGGIDLLSWGVEACEESWKSGMFKVIAGSVVAVICRVYGVYVSFSMNAELRDEELQRLGGQGGRREVDSWVDEDSASEMNELNKSSLRGLEETLAGNSNHRRSRSTSSTSRSGGRGPSPTSSTRRSNTLPATGLPPRYSDPTAVRPRSQSSNEGNRPRLVLLPVYVDRQGNPVASPTSARSPPAYRSRSSTSPTSDPSHRSKPSSGSSSAARPPPPPRKRSYSATSYSSSSSSSSPPLKRSPPLPPLYTSEPLPLSSSPDLSSSTSSSTETTSSKIGRSRRSRHRSDTDFTQIVPQLLPVQA